MNNIPMSTLEQMIEMCNHREAFIDTEKIIRQERNAFRRFYMKTVDNHIKHTKLPDKSWTELTPEEILAWGEQNITAQYMKDQKEFNQEFAKYQKLLDKLSEKYGKFVREEFKNKQEGNDEY